jgi:hypothetical protein
MPPQRRHKRSTAQSIPRNTSQVVDLTANVKSSREYLDYGHAFVPPPSTEVAKLGSPDGRFKLCAGDDLDLYLVPFTQVPGNGSCIDMWNFKDNLVPADEFGRHLHIYENTMLKLGVSRLRLSENRYVPNSAVYV